MGHKCIIITGMHRSGTSALAGVIKHLGVDFGEDLLPPQPDNPKGFFENRELVKINDEILHYWDSNWYDLSHINYPINQVLSSSTEFISLYNRAVNFLQVIIEKERLFGLKDPRFCLTLPFWKKIFIDLGITPIFLISIRNPSETSKSLTKRNGFTQNDSLLLYGKYMLNLEEFTKKDIRKFIHFETLINEPIRILNIILLHFKENAIDIIDFKEKVNFIKNDFLDSSLKHHTFTDEGKELTPSLYFEIHNYFLNKIKYISFPFVIDKKFTILKNEYLDLLSINKHQEQIPAVLYYRTQDEDKYSESNKLVSSILINEDNQLVCFNLTSIKGEITGLRLDLTERVSIVRIYKIELIKENSSQELNFSSNAAFVKDNIYVFTTLDPNIFPDISLNNDRFKQLIVSFQLLESTKDGVIDKLIQHNIAQMDTSEKIKDQLIKNEALLKELETRLDRKEELLFETKSEFEQALKTKEELLLETKSEFEQELKSKEELLLETKSEFEQVLKTKEELLLETKSEFEQVLKSKEELLLETKSEFEQVLKTKEELLLETKSEFEQILKSKEELLLETKSEFEQALKSKEELLLETKSKFEQELKTKEALLLETKSKFEQELKTKQELLLETKSKFEQTLKSKEALLLETKSEFEQTLKSKEALLLETKTKFEQELVFKEEQYQGLEKGLLITNKYYSELKNSWSNRLGFGLTAPFRWVYDLFTIGNGKLGILFKMISIGVSKPKTAMTMVNKRNLKTFSTALRNESPEKIKKNLNNLSNKTEKILAAEEMSGQNDIIYTIDECSIIDDPGMSQNFLIVRGWAISHAKIEKIELVSEGKPFRIEYERHRPDVKTVYPEYPNSEFSEFYMLYLIEEHFESVNITIKNQVGTVISIDQIVEEIQDYAKLNLDEQYRIYRIKNELDKTSIQGIVQDCQSFQYRPKISIVTPVYNVDPKWLDLCIQSVLDQYYDNWEFCLYDDASTNQDTIDCLKKWSRKDKRILVEFGKENQHISGASNGAIKLVTGEFIALLDNDDEITPDALYEVVKLLNQRPNLDYIYSDEDKLTLSGELIGPHFKPDWSPETFESMMYPCHLGIFRSSKIRQIGGFRKGYEGSQDYDLVLRFTEIAKEIAHIPKILYHWRMIPGSAAASVNAKSYAYVAAKKALTDRLKREGYKGEVLDGYWTGSYRMKREIPAGTKVGIIIPFKDQVDITLKCVASVLKSTFNNFEILLVSNNSKPEQLQKIKNLYGRNEKIKILNYDIPFNYSKINNWAVSKTDANYLLFLNNDTEVINEDWLEALLEIAIKKEVGAVGAKLLYPNNTIQHAGAVLGIYGVANHPFKSLPAADFGYFGYASVAKNCSAVTGACLLVKKDKFLAVGGFDEINLPVSYNDIDLCLKLIAKGYRTVYTPYASLYHYESYTRKASDFEALKESSESEYMYNKWGDLIECDPYYNCNLTLFREDYSLRICNYSAFAKC